MRHSPVTRDLTVAELDDAIAECTGISNAYSGIGQKAALLVASAQSRHNHLKQILGSICDTCAAYPCMIGSKVGAFGTCAVCSTPVAPLRDVARHSLALAMRQGTIMNPTIAREVSQLEDRMRVLKKRLQNPAISRIALLLSAPSSPDRLRALISSGKPEAMTRQQMLQKSAAELQEAQQALSQVQAKEKDCKAEIDGFKQQQQQLLSRLAGVGHKRGRDDDDGLCCVCKSCDKTSLLIPCGHKCLCEQCATRYRRGSTCPLCRQTVESVQRVYD